MAVPKRKTTPSKKGMRSAGKGLKPINISHDSKGEEVLSHHMSPDGFYNGKQIIKPTAAKKSESQ